MTQVLLTVTIPTVTVLGGILVGNARQNDTNLRISDLRMDMNDKFAAMDVRMTDLKETLRAELRRVEEVMDARLKHLEERVK